MSKGKKKGTNGTAAHDEGAQVLPLNGEGEHAPEGHTSESSVDIPEQRRTITAEVILMDEELLAAGAELAECMQEVASLEDQKKNLAEQKKNEIAQVEARASELGRQISTKRVHREFYCVAEFDWENHIKRWKSVSDGVVRSTEAISPSDYQMKLRLEEEQREDTDQTSTVPDYSPEDAAHDGEEVGDLVSDEVLS